MGLNTRGFRTNFRRFWFLTSDDMNPIRLLRPMSTSASSAYASSSGRASEVLNVAHVNPIMFPGQGVQFVGMPNDAHTSKNSQLSSIYTSMFNRASNILGYDLLDVCKNGPESKLNATSVAQPAIFVSSMAALEAFRLESPKTVDSCTVTMGLSLGEYSALCFAGCFTFEDGIRLIKVRSDCMQLASDLHPTGMIAINGLSVSDLSDFCTTIKTETGEDIYIGNYLTEKASTLSGTKNACNSALKIAQQRGAKSATILPVSGAFHTRFMDSAVKPLLDELNSIELHPLRIPVYSNYDGCVYTSVDDVKRLLVQQVNHPVQWHKIVSSMLSCPSFNKKCFEVGPGTACKSIVKAINRRIDVTSVG